MSTSIKTGIFVVVGIGLFCLGLFLIGSSTNLFGSHFTVYTQFNNIDALTSGATVRVGGMDAGQVAGIQVPKGPAGQFRLKLHVDKKFHPIVRKDSTVSIETEGFVGNKFVNIAKGSANSPECPAGCTLPSQESASMGQLMREASTLAVQIQGTIQHADGVLQSFGNVGNNANGMIVAIRPKITQMTSDAEAILGGVREGKGAAGKLLTDKVVAADVTAAVANTKQATANFAQTSRKVNGMVSGVQKSDMPGIHQTVENAQQLTGRLNSAAGTFVGSHESNENTAKEVQQTIDQAQQAIGNLAADTEAIKTNFLLRGFFNRRGFYNFKTITPSKYAASQFVKHPRARIWIPGADLFESGPQGQPELKGSGRAVLNQRMSAFVAYLPNNPIVVEGYSTNGAPDQQYLTSRLRAIDVRDYLIQQFHLDPKFVGMMPLADRPPKETGKQNWDGVCLVLVISKQHHGLF